MPSSERLRDRPIGDGLWISAIQDVFATELQEPWSATAGAMPDVDARFHGDRLIVWFGPEGAPALVLTPLLPAG